MSEPRVYEWLPCSGTKPPVAERVLVWHRVRPWCRFYQATVGWWNSEEWRRDDSHSSVHGLIYQPKLWRYIEEPKT
jgi:hypothetical protein